MAIIGNALTLGGAGLNFKVVGGTTQPSNPTENTIWVNTSEAITGWAFSRDEPTTATEGLVWIKTGFSSPVTFNALKKEAIVLCPLKAQQYISGAWVEMTALSYQSSAWQDWYTWIVASGIGTLVEFGYRRSGSNVTVTFDENGITIDAWGSSGNTAYVGTTNKLNVTDYSQLVIEIYRAGTGTEGTIGLYPNIYTGSYGTAVVSSNMGAGTHTYDISNISGSYYLNCQTFSDTVITDVYLIP